MNTRIKNLDNLRGILIILAFIQHYAYFLNIWYIDFINKNQYMKVDDITYLLAFYLTPFVNQMYMMMSSFNIGLKNRLEFRKNIYSKIKIYIYFFILSFIENIIVSQNIGESLSIYPLQIWILMIIMISVIYSFLGANYVFVIFLTLIILKYSLPIEEFGDKWEILLKQNLHPYFEYNARIEYFLGSALSGFLLSYGYFQLKKYNLNILITLIFGISIFIVFGPELKLDPYDILVYEYDFAKNLFAEIGFCSINAILIMFLLFLSKKGFDIKIPFVNYIGVNSLFFFILHKIIFLYIIMPIQYFLGITIKNNFFFIMFYVILSLLISYIFMFFYNFKFRFSKQKEFQISLTDIF